MKSFNTLCTFGDQKSNFTFYIGQPEFSHHPIDHQMKWLSSTKGGSPSDELVKILEKLHTLAKENNANFEEMCYYALTASTNETTSKGDIYDVVTQYAEKYLLDEVNDEISSIKNSSSDTGNEANKNLKKEDISTAPLADKNFKQDDIKLDDDLLLDDDLSSTDGNADNSDNSTTDDSSSTDGNADNSDNSSSDDSLLLEDDVAKDNSIYNKDDEDLLG